ncbi:MAG: tetraacyldisaccharide 4'-kinase [Hyphomicrobiales bacterium]|nr:tetraacyldisaccharide 4'-kinase [Rickettsiales bacterium]MCP5361223.1 tetraacyldisaccharide 4'-kinase [Hyphomicrobiales bacterium]
MPKAPKFWAGPRGLRSELLVPFSVITFFINRLRSARAKPVSVGVPVVCVGNATVGGAGKTPTVLSLIDFLKPRYPRLACVSKGYGGKQHIPVRVDSQKHTARDVGDEPLLIAQKATCWVGQDRVKTCQTAVEGGAELILLDDGLQDPRLIRQCSLIVVDSGFGFGNRLILPAGPLRDRVDYAYRAADAMVMIGEDVQQIAQEVPKTMPVFRAHMQANDGLRLPKDGRFVAFAGIGRPQKFFDTLAAMGINVVHSVAYPDHHPYTKRNQRKLLQIAAEYEALLLTTEKDAVRFPPEFREHLHALPVHLEWERPRDLAKFLKEHLP